MTDFIHDTLPCGIEYALTPLPRRHVVSFQLRVIGGLCTEPANRLGLTRLTMETIDKGTERRSGRELSDAFDAIGAVHANATGRESVQFTCTVLPEHLEQAVALHAEMIRTPTFPDDAFRVNVELARQELTALEDDAQGLADKLISARAFGPYLGRHGLGERDAIDQVTREDVLNYWRQNFTTGRMILAVAGPVEPTRIVELFERAFSGFGSAQPDGRAVWPVSFSDGVTHHHKTLEQEQISLCFSAVAANHADYPVQQAVIGILSGGMSGRLFTEVREKLGLVYWVSAWQDTPRGAGRVFLGASTTPERCDKTFAALLREVDRLAEDITTDELVRAVTGIVAAQETRGDSTRARCAELASDLFFFSRPVPPEEKTARVHAVTVQDIRRYLAEHPREKLCVVTLGPRPLSMTAP